MAPGIAHVGLFHGDTPVRKVALLQARRGEGGPSGTSCRRVRSVSDSGSSSKRPRVHSVSESRRRGRGAGFKGARTRSFPHTHARAHSSRHSPTHTLACVRARRHTRTCACSWAHAPHVHPRACVRACRRSHAVRSRAIAHMRVCVQTHTPAHSHTCGSTRDAGTLPAAGASAPTAVSRDLRLRSRRRAGLCVLSREGREEAALGDPEGAS